MAKPKTARPGAPKTATIRARIDSTLKAKAEAILDTLGLNPSDAIRLFYTQITLSAGLPFPVRVPNAETLKALRDAEAGRVTRNPGTAAMFEDMAI